MANEDTPDTEADLQRPLGDVRAFYRTGDDVTVATLPVGTSRVVARRATGEVVDADLGVGARFPDLGPGHTPSRRSTPAATLLAEELTTVGAHRANGPYMALPPRSRTRTYRAYSGGTGRCAPQSSRSTTGWRATPSR